MDDIQRARRVWPVAIALAVLASTPAALRGVWHALHLEPQPNRVGVMLFLVAAALFVAAMGMAVASILLVFIGYVEFAFRHRMACFWAVLAGFPAWLAGVVLM